MIVSFVVPSMLFFCASLDSWVILSVLSFVSVSSKTELTKPLSPFHCRFIYSWGLISNIYRFT